MAILNTYIIDTFLAFWLWFGLTLLYWDVSSLVKKANEALTADIFAVYFDMLAKPVILISILPIAVYAFLVWRFCSLLVQAQMWGIGAIGLTVILALAGVALIWLKVLMMLILQRIEAPSPPKASKQPQFDQFGRQVA